MKQKWLVINLMFVVLFVLTSCAGAQTPVPTQISQAIEIVDGLGRTVHMPAAAQRVVSLAPSNTEILFAIGAGSQVVGRDEFSNYPTEASALPAIGGSFGGYNEEAIVNLKPDLVLAAEINTEEQIKSLEALGLTVFWLANPTTIDGMYQNLLILAQMTGHESEAMSLIEQLKQRVEAVEEKTASLSNKPTVFYEIDATDPQAPYTAGPGTFIDLLISQAGGVNIASNLGSPWGQLSAEELLISDPAIILLGDSNYGMTPEMVAQRPGWESLSSVKNNTIFSFDDDLVSRPGPRMVAGLEAMAKLFHPDVFK